MRREPIYRLPPYRTELVLRALAETVDWRLASYGIPEVWKQTRGRGIKIAVLDMGIDEDHPDLADTLIAAQDFTDSPAGPHDRAGHGTHCSGIIAARQNDFGLVGICPDLKQNGGGLLIGKVLGDDGAGTDASVVAGIEWAIQQGAHLISMSLGSPQASLSMLRAIRRAVGQGIFVIAAAGNNGRGNLVDYPGRWPETIAVGAVDRDGHVASFSSRGPEVDIAAPGQDVLSTFPGGRYARLSGTSMATPFVTGVVALMLSKHKSHGGDTPIKNVKQLREHLARTATDAGSIGEDPAYGYGLINPLTMLGPAAPIDLPPWAGLRWDVQIAGAPAAVVLVPRESRVTIDPMFVDGGNRP